MGLGFGNWKTLWFVQCSWEWVHQFGHERTGLNLSLKVRLQIPCPISEFPSWSKKPRYKTLRQSPSWESSSCWKPSERQQYPKSATQLGCTWVNLIHIFRSVQVGMGLIFFLAGSAVLQLGWDTHKVLMTHQCFSSCWPALSQPQGTVSPCSSCPVRRLRAHRQMGDPDWQEELSIFYNIMLSSKTGEHFFQSTGSSEAFWVWVYWW